MEYYPPEITESINRIVYLWPDMELKVQAERITDDGSAEISFYHENGSGSHLMHLARVNLLSSSTMTQLAKRMVKHSKDVPWEQVLTVICSKTTEISRRGEEPTVIEPASASVTRPVYLLEPLIMKGVPNVIYGDKGVNKTTLATACLGLMATGDTESILGLIPQRPVRSGLLDWESNRDLTEYTIARLIEGGTVPWFNLPYLRCQRSLADEIDKIANFITANNIEMVLIDSLGQAAGSDKFDSAGKGSALKFFECLRLLNVTSLIIAQNAKGEDRKKSIFGSTYFTYYSRNIWELKADGDSIREDEMSIALFNEASNYSRRRDPLGWRLEYTDTTIKMTAQSVTMSDFLEKVSQSKVLLDFLKDGAKTRKAIIEEMDVSATHVDVLISRLKKKNMITSLGSGLWGLKYDDSQL